MKLVRESLFSSTIRSFCISFFAVIGIVIAFFLVMLVFGAGKSSKALEMSNFEVIIPDTNGRKYPLASAQPLLLRLDIVGPIMPDNAGMFASSSIGIDYIRSVLNESHMGPLKDNRIKGVLLYINSPGGAGYLCEPIYKAIKEYSLKYQIPVYAYVEGYCASAAMYIACSAQKIYSNSSSIIGSVGAFWKFFNYSQGMQKIGVENKTLTAGKGKDAMNPFQPWEPDSSDNYQAILDETYDQFVSVVAASRPKLSKSSLVNKYGAEVYYSPTAERLGYIDGAGYQYNQVVQLLAEEAGIVGNNYQVVQLQPKVKFSDIFGISSSLKTKSNPFELLKSNPLEFFSKYGEYVTPLSNPAH